MFLETTKHGCFDTDNLVVFDNIHMCYLLSKLEADGEREREGESEILTTSYIYIYTYEHIIEKTTQTLAPHAPKYAPPLSTHSGHWKVGLYMAGHVAAQQAPPRNWAGKSPKQLGYGKIIETNGLFSSTSYLITTG